MANIDLSRIRSNIQGLNILHSLRTVNNELATHQLRLGTGQRINSAGDDPAGMTIATKLRSRYRMLSAVYDNIGQAKNMMSVAEGGLLNMSDILVTMNEKLIAAASDSLGSEERNAIVRQLVQQVAELQDIAGQTEFNGVSLLDSAQSFNFQTGPDSQTVWQTSSFAPDALGMVNMLALLETDVIDSANYQTYRDEVDAAMSAVSNGLTAIGSLMNRMTTKEDAISVARINTEAAFSRIFNADMAVEQMEVTKYTILQQTSLAMLAQANLNGQSLLMLFQ
ncbi:MAG: flagellin [Candidatus Eisenbacteria bacterium]|uniref:Flagellin n=1 Tax=Eiseniibacteriota bacterium TaxID=2212470 RepID=A0A937X9Z4_UNCEI|nr:flagellin [Candidatus Eisenbacteria bacterium]